MYMKEKNVEGKNVGKIRFEEIKWFYKVIIYATQSFEINFVILLIYYILKYHFNNNARIGL